MDELFLQAREHPEPEVRQRCLSVLRSLVLARYELEGDGYMGIRMMSEMVDVPGRRVRSGAIRVTDVMADSAAQRAGVKQGDLIVALDGDEWEGEAVAIETFQARIRSLKPGSEVELQLLRGNALEKCRITLQRRPAYADSPSFNLPTKAQMEAAEQNSRDTYFDRWLENRRNPLKLGREGQSR